MVCIAPLRSSYIEDKHGSLADPYREQTQLVSSLPARLEGPHHTGLATSLTQTHPLQWHHGLAYSIIVVYKWGTLNVELVMGGINILWQERPSDGSYASDCGHI